MMMRIVQALAALVVLGALAFGGWWFAASRGWIPGKPNSPRPENFKAALDEYFARTANLQSRQCASVGYSQSRQSGHADTAFDWTPAGFLLRLDGDASRMQFLARRLPLLQKHGLLQVRQGEGGVQEYTLTWKGYVASNGSGCFYLTSGEREAKVLAGEKARVENGVEIYEVVARPQPKAVEPWAQDPGFKDAFEGQNFRTLLDPEPVTYELARGERGFTVVGEKNRQGSPRLQASTDAVVLAKLMGTVTPERVMQALNAYLDKAPGRNQACLELPVQGEADESNVFNAYAAPGMQPPPATFTFYNLLERRDYAAANALRGYEMLRRLESVGMAKHELMPVAEWQGRIAAGGVRFELSAEAMGRLTRANPRCLPVGVVVPEEVLLAQQFTEQQPRPRFIARTRLKPDAEAKPLVDKFAHFARLVEPGGVMQGTLRYQDGQLHVEHAQVMNARFMPDVTQVRLPIVEAPPPSRVAPAPPGRAPVIGPGRDVVWEQVMGMSRLSDGGLTMTYCCAGASTPAISSVAQSSGRWYAELTLRTRRGRTSPDTWTNAMVAPQPRQGSTELFMAATRTGALGRDKNRFRDGDVIGVALDADSGRAWYSLNGDWLNGTPLAGGGEPLPRGVPFVIVATSSASSDMGPGGAKDAWTANFGKTRFRGQLPRGFRSWDGRQQAQ